MLHAILSRLDASSVRDGARTESLLGIPGITGLSSGAEQKGRKRRKAVAAHLPSARGGDRQGTTEHRPTLPTGQPNDRLFADGPRRTKEGKRDRASIPAEASATNYADLCPHCPLSELRAPEPGPEPGPAAWPCATVNGFDGRRRSCLCLCRYRVPGGVLSRRRGEQSNGPTTAKTAGVDDANEEGQREANARE